MRKIANALRNFETKVALYNAGCDTREDGDHLVEVLGVIVIAVVVLLLFRTQIVDLFTNAMATVKTKIIDTLFTDAAGTSTP